MTPLLSGTFVAWANAWLAGAAGTDDVIAAVTGDDPPHQAVLADGSGAGLAALLIEARRDAGPLRLALPVPGDLRGLPGPADFRAAALDAGEAVCGRRLGVVPEEIDFAPSSAPPTVRWVAFEIDDAPHDHVGVADAQHELAEAVRDCTAALTAADVAAAADPDALHAARHASERLVLPPSHPARAVALLARAERLQAMLDLAAADPAGGAVDRFGMSARDSSLRPLALAVRRARLAGYNAAAIGAATTERNAGETSP